MSAAKKRLVKEKDVNLPEKERLPLQQQISDFLNSGKTELVLPNLSREHRKYLHKYVVRLGLKSCSYGSKNNRTLHITHRTRLITLGDVCKLELANDTHRLLLDLLPTIRSQLQSASRSEQQLPHHSKQGRHRNEGLLSGLGSQMVPPPPRRIADKLFREKKDLPINRYREDVVKTLENNSIFIVNGETGSGKTTQIPQYILSDAFHKSRPCRIVVTQPRRVAAVSVAHRVAEERGEQLGDSVGYQIRMESRVSKTTNLIYTTSGWLLRSIMSDVQDVFRKITHLIIDEIHERDKFTDFTLITIKEQLKHNKNLKVILMSATMDIPQLSQYFDDCPVLNVPGQGYDVKIYHLEDILYHTGYRTALMAKYLRLLNEAPPPQCSQNFSLPITNAVMPNDQSNATTMGGQFADEYMQELLDQCCETGRCEEELCEIFDQMQYYIESEGMSVDVGHVITGLTPLMAACKCNIPRYVQSFMRFHPNIYLRDAQGFTAIDYATVHIDGVCMQMLGTNISLPQQQQLQQNQKDLEKQRLLTAYQQQFREDDEVDHDLMLSLIEGLYRSPHPGAIMVFLPGYNDIVMQRDLINSTLPPDTYRICVLHGQMDSQDQFEALQCLPVRKIILSTNIGQTSITIPDLAYIIDSGKVKMKTYDCITESSQLQAVWISKADANQRSGRAGRTQNGICYRLYSLTKYDSMATFCSPEFMRIPLTEICLYAKTLDDNCDVRTYLSRALNPPSLISIQNAIRKLQLLGIFNDDESVTELGKHLVELPMDVQLGKCLLYSIFLKCFDPILTIVAFHSIKDPFILPTDRTAQGQASFLRKSFAGKSFSDHMGILSLYKAYCAVRHNRKRLRDFCNKHYLSQSAMEMFCATRRQIADLISQKFRLGQNATLFNDDWNMVRFCLVAGFYPNIAVIDRTRNLIKSGAEKQLMLQRTSSLNPPGMKTIKEFIHQLPHDWVVFYEKSRVGHMCSINMNTLVPPIVVALQCGRDCSIEEDDLKESDTTDDDDDGYAGPGDANQKDIIKAMKDLSTDSKQNTVAILSLDNWIKFELCASDAKMLVLLRSLVSKQFLTFLRHGHSTHTATAAYCIQKLLNSLQDVPVL